LNDAWGGLCVSAAEYARHLRWGMRSAVATSRDPKRALMVEGQQGVLVVLRHLAQTRATTTVELDVKNGCVRSVRAGMVCYSEGRGVHTLPVPVEGK